MFIEFFRTQHAIQNPLAKAEAIYHLKADTSYQVSHEPLHEGGAILIYTIGGKGVLENEGRSYLLEQDTVLLIMPTKACFQYYTMEETWEFWWFESSVSHSLLKEGKIHKVKAEPLLTEMFQSCLSCLRQGRGDWASSLYIGLEAHLSVCIAENRDRFDDQKLFQRACQKIHQQLGTITVAQVAQEIGMGERELRTLFWKHGTCSPIQYITAAKLELACFMLKNTNKLIGEIAETLGYSSQFYFCRVFKNQFRCTPSDWRKRKDNT